jgi:hypothetical protein
MSLQTRRRAAVDRLVKELEAIVVADEQGLLEYIPLAARLAALGDSEPLARWTELARPFGSRLESLLVERCQEGVWDLRNAVGKDLGLAVIDAQDFYCFLRRERRQIPEQARRALIEWSREADLAALNYDSVTTLRRFLRRFPLRPANRLAVVDTPMTVEEWTIVAMMAPPRPVIDVKWPPPVTA